MSFVEHAEEEVMLSEQLRMATLFLVSFHSLISDHDVWRFDGWYRRVILSWIRRKSMHVHL